jgi:hypothetical protein
LTPARTESLTPLQALALLNDRFVLRHAELLAKRLDARDRDLDLDAQLDWAFLLTLGRPPNPDELREWRAYAQRRGLANACRLLFNSSEFLFVD